MTYLKTALIASALTAATASTAFAGEKNWSETKAEMKTTTTATKVMQAPSKANDTIGEVLQMDGQPDTQTDMELLTHDGDMLTKSEALSMDSDHTIANNAIVVPSSSGALTTVNCPIGTTAKPDMTCHVTGNYDMANSNAMLMEENKMNNQVAGVVNTNTSYSTTTTYEMNNSEYKGTLRPDTMVKENVNVRYED